MKRIVPVILLLMIAVLGCKLPSAIRDMTSGGTSKGSDGSSPLSSESRGTDPREDVVAASNKFMALPYFTAKMEGMGQTEIKSEVKFVAPDRFHVKYLGTGTGAGMEMIFLGKDMYMNANGKWTKMPSTNTSLPTLRDSFTEEGLKMLTDVKFEGPDTVDGKSTYVYSYKNVTPVGNYPFTSKIWVGEDTGLPVKIFVEYTNGALNHMKIDYDTETPVTIDPPVK